MRLIVQYSHCILFSIFLLILTKNVKAQISNTGIYFQAIARDNFSNPAKDRKIFVQSSIIQNNINGAIVLKEEFQTNTDASGIFGISLGLGRHIGGIKSTLNSIEWENGPYFLNLKISIEPVAPVSNWDYTKDWIDLGTTPFGTVPYALYSNNSGSFKEKLNITDTSTMLQPYKNAIKALQLNEKSFDTSILRNQFLQKLNYSDTANMLSGYLRVGAIVPFTGSISFNDLTNKPSLFSGNYIDLLNKPSLFDGDYNSLRNRPILFNGDYNSLLNIPSLNLNGDITSVGSTTTLAISGVLSGTYGSAIEVPTFTVDNKGRITNAHNNPISPNNFPNKTNAEKNAMPLTTASGTVIWCSNCGSKGQLQVYNGSEWTDLIGGTAANSEILFSPLILSSINSNSLALIGAVLADGGTPILTKGVVWSTNVNPTIALSTKTNNGTGIGSFNTIINNLTKSTLYYIRSYATNSNGTVYGEQQSFTTQGEVPTINTSIATNIGLTEVTTGGNIINNGGLTITQRGVCWSTNNNPSINDNKLVVGEGNSNFTINITGLNAGTTYYLRAYAINSAGIGYGALISFTTSNITVGSSYLGGKVAYIFQLDDVGYISGQTHGYIIMNHHWNIEKNFMTGQNTFSSVGLFFDFGKGKSNTIKMYNHIGGLYGAAKYVYNQYFDNYNDWYIPSFGDWEKIGLNWALLGLPVNGEYQSSSEFDSSNSYYFNVESLNGNLITTMKTASKNTPHQVIGIRNF